MKPKTGLEVPGGLAWNIFGPLGGLGIPDILSSVSGFALHNETRIDDAGKAVSSSSGWIRTALDNLEDLTPFGNRPRPAPSSPTMDDPTIAWEYWNGAAGPRSPSLPAPRCGLSARRGRCRSSSRTT